MKPQALSSIIWSVTDLLHWDYKQSDYRRVNSLSTVLGRLDCALGATRPIVNGQIDIRIAMSQVAAKSPEVITA